MKKFKFILTTLLLLAFLGCEDDDRELQYLDAIEAPTEFELQFRTTQDNSGLITMTPSAIGASKFDIAFGDGSGDAVTLNPGETAERVYEEGNYTITAVATALNGLTTVIERSIDVVFISPQNLEVSIENDGVVSNTVRVTATAEFGIFYEVDFGEPGDDDIRTANMGDEIVYEYQAPGTYTITVSAFSAAIAPTVYVEDFEVTANVQPMASAPTPPTRAPEDVIGIYSEAYPFDPANDFFPFWGQNNPGYAANEFDLNGDLMLQYTNLSYQGIQLGSNIDVSEMEMLHLDVWTPDDIDAQVFLISPGPNETAYDMDLVEEQWTSFDIPLSFFTDQNPLVDLSNIFQFKFEGQPSGAGSVFIDNIYFYKAPAMGPTITGTWKLASEANSLGVGPSVGDTQWFSCDDACVATRACYFDDTYFFGFDGTFQNDLGADSWIEGWQGGGDACGAPVAPHDGSNPATYVYDAGAGTLTVNGVGSYIGLPKAVNAGELPNVAVPNSITYNVNLIDNFNMEVWIEAGSGVFWQYKLVKESEAPNPLAGTWQMANEGNSLGVGPSVGNTSWFSCDAACVSTRACYFDDSYVFGADGSFQNVLGADSWIEGWQGGGDSCGAPVAPHDGSNPATYSYDVDAGTITLNGEGAYIGLPKAVNAGELPNVAVPSSVTYNVTFIDDNTINVYIESGAGVFWQYKLIKL